MRRRLTVLLVASIAVAIGAAIPVSRLATKHRMARLTSCTGNLVHLKIALQMYAADNNGKYPARLSELSRYLAGQPQLLWCFANRSGRPGSMATVDEWTEYTYIHGHQIGDPPDSLVAYCNSGAHGQNQTTALFMGGSAQRITWRELADHMARMEDRRPQQTPPGDRVNAPPEE
jgi:hypothetical protein